MPHRRPSRRVRRIRVAGLLALIAAIAAARGDQLPASSPPATIELLPRVPRDTPVSMRGVAGVDRALVAALRRAATAAAGDGVGLHVKSGRRSPEHQQELLREAIAKYGSVEEASRWVATPGTSPHVSGDAVDVGPSAGAAWLAEHGARYGLCQIYANEPWHYELRPDTAGRGCPPMYADPTHDPRMQP